MIEYHSSAVAWGSFPYRVEQLATASRGLRICELGGGANPLLSPERVRQLDLDYTIVDISASELEKAAPEYKKKCLDIAAPDLEWDAGFDVVFSRMLAEHVRDGRAFHRNVFRMLRPGGVALHFFPTLYSPPFLMNYFLPQRLGEPLLRVLQPLRAREGKHAKFPAYYDWCRGPSLAQVRRFEQLGYAVEEYHGYFGHSKGWTVGAGYYDRLPPLLALHHWACRSLLRRPIASLTSYARILLRRPNPTGENQQEQRDLRAESRAA